MLMLLLGQRQELVRGVGAWKRRRGLSVPDPKREREILAQRLALAAESGLDPAFLRKIFGLIFANSRAVQR